MRSSVRAVLVSMVLLTVLSGLVYPVLTSRIPAIAAREPSMLPGEPRCAPVHRLKTWQEAQSDKGLTRRRSPLGRTVALLTM